MSKTWDEMRKESEEERQLIEMIIQMLIEAKISGKRAVKNIKFCAASNRRCRADERS